MMISFLWTVGHPRTASHPTSASHHRLYVTILSTCSGDTKSACNDNFSSCSKKMLWLEKTAHICTLGGGGRLKM